MKDGLPQCFDMTNFLQEIMLKKKKKKLKYILCLGLSHNLTANKNRNCPIIPYLNKCTDIQFSISITPVYILHNLNWKKTRSVALFILQVKPYINGYGNKCTLAMKECSLPHNWSLFLQCNFKFQEVF